MEAQAVNGEVLAIIGNEIGIVFKRCRCNDHVDQAECPSSVCPLVFQFSCELCNFLRDRVAMEALKKRGSCPLFAMYRV